MRRRITFAIVVTFIVFVFFGLISVFSLKKAYTSSQKAVGAAKLQDLDATKAYLKDAKRDFKAAKTCQKLKTSLQKSTLGATRISYQASPAQRLKMLKIHYRSLRHF